MVTVNFGDMIYHGTLPHNMSIDVVLYDGNYENYTGDCSYGECRRYPNHHGVPDCAGNNATPVWRRFTVDGMPPTMEVISEDSETEVEIEVCDETSGIDTGSFLIDGQPISSSGYDYSWTDINNHCGILTIDIGEDAGSIRVRVDDNAGNYLVQEIHPTPASLVLSNVKVYPNPLHTADGEYARIAYELNKACDVTIKIYDFAGVHVMTVVDGHRSGDAHVENWLGVDEDGNPVAPGAYIGYIKADDGSKVVTKNLKIAIGHGD
jgi:hypothetical protein